MRAYLDFEKPIAELESKILELQQLHADSDSDGDTDSEAKPELDIGEEVDRLQSKAESLLADTYRKLTPWQKTQVARHANRPHFSDYVASLVSDFTPLAGDRFFAEDSAVIGGLGRLDGRTVMLIGHEKGDDTESRIAHNFGMARPEGYRKAIRLMHMANRFSLPVVTIVDTPGAYPGVGAEERGQAEAIARSTEACLEIGVPIIACITGEGMSGGAVAIASGNRVLMLEHAIYSVISPEGCASILWREAEKAQEAAAAMRLTAQDLLKLKVIDEIIAEPVGGAHRHPEQTIANIGAAISRHLQAFDGLTAGEIRQARRQKFLEIGQEID